MQLPQAYSVNKGEEIQKQNADLLTDKPWKLVPKQPNIIMLRLY